MARKVSSLGLDTQWLDTFVRLARTPKQQEVAKELGTTQATVSRHVTALERWLNRLLVKRGSPVELTEDGEQFAKIAANILDQLHSARADPNAGSPPSPEVSGKNIVI